MDAVTLDGLIGELRPRLVGRYLGRPRLGGPAGLSFEVSGEKARLWLDASRETPGLYWLDRDQVRRLESLAETEAPGRARQALLHVRKHMDGARVQALRRVAGERTVVLESADGALLLSLGGASVLTLLVEGEALGSFGDGGPAGLLPTEAPEKEWDRVPADAVEGAVRAARMAGRSVVRAVLEVCPGLSPKLAREIEEGGGSYEGLRERLRAARPTLLSPGLPDTWRDADLAAVDTVVLRPLPAPGGARGGVSWHPPSWSAAAALFLEARLRGAHFTRLKREALGGVRKEAARLEQLESHLTRDLGGLPDEAALRRDGEALLAAAPGRPLGEAEVEVPDPYEPARTRRIGLDPGMSWPQNADRLFAKARRVERARRTIEARLLEARTKARAAREREAKVEAVGEARELQALGRPAPARQGPSAPARSTGPRHYLTGRGLSVLVGRGARENHRLTFTVAGPEDLWLHARDVPGAHVILKDPEGRADANDIREAAEVAAFFSEAATEGQADVHVARRKHLRPGRGGPGRVSLGQTETVRAAPRDPEGRLRRR